MDEPQRFVIQPGPDGSFAVRKPGVYGVEVGNGLAVGGEGTSFVPLYEVKEPPGKPLPNRRDPRRWAREAARQLTRGRRRRVVAWQPGTAEESGC